MLKILFNNCLFLLLLLEYYVTAQEDIPTESPDTMPPATSKPFKYEIKDHDTSTSTVKRYVIENDYLPPIFGSYKYNAVFHRFDLSPVVWNYTSSAKTDISKDDFYVTKTHIQRTASPVFEYKIRASTEMYAKLKSAVYADIRNKITTEKEFSVKRDKPSTTSSPSTDMKISQEDNSSSNSTLEELGAAF